MQIQKLTTLSAAAFISASVCFGAVLVSEKPSTETASKEIITKANIEKNHTDIPSQNPVVESKPIDSKPVVTPSSSKVLSQVKTPTLEKESEQTAHLDVFIRQNEHKKAVTVLNELRLLDAAIDQYALEYKKSPSVVPTFSDLTDYMNRKSALFKNGGKDSIGNPIIIKSVGEPPQVNPKSKKLLEEITGGDTFWGQYS